MKVLVTVATKHGSTREIAEMIADELRASGLEVDVREAGSVIEITSYEAVVLGSAVYTGGWLADATRFAHAHGPALRKMPVWLFSSGPIGVDDAKLLDDPPETPELFKLTQAREHRLFGGKLDKESLDRFDQYVARVVQAPEGDFRDWDAVRAWARRIASSLAGVQTQTR
ncbi:MAG: flavodoxin [Chloroflexi bacterium]|nr:MAG: flavodoxin [Chloroflexota bacterium]